LYVECEALGTSSLPCPTLIRLCRPFRGIKTRRPNRKCLMIESCHNDACIFTYKILLLHINMQTKNRTHGVLIADVVESRSHSHLRSSLNEKLRIASIAQLDDKLIRVPYAITAAEESQTIAPLVDPIPKFILSLRTQLHHLHFR